MNEMRLAKFETLIEDINDEIKKEEFMAGIKIGHLLFAPNPIASFNVPLTLIFDYNSCNEYAQKIIEKSTLFINSESDVRSDKWITRYPDMESLSDAKTKIDAATLFVKYCRESQNISEGYKFIFWALMILTVDKNNAEEYLTLICDFSKMLRITNEEFEDIIYIIKCVYHENDKEYTLKTKNVHNTLGGIVNLYGDPDMSGLVEKGK